MQDNATDYVTRVRYLAIWCINLHRYFTVLHFLEVKIPEQQRCPILTLRRLLRRVLVLVLNIVSRNDASYGADSGYAEAVDSYCNMDPTRIILENVGRNFHGNYSCQVRAVLNIAALSPLLPIMDTVWLISQPVLISHVQGKNRAGWGAVSNSSE